MILEVLLCPSLVPWPRLTAEAHIGLIPWTQGTWDVESGLLKSVDRISWIKAHPSVQVWALSPAPSLRPLVTLWYVRALRSGHKAEAKALCNYFKKSLRDMSTIRTSPCTQDPMAWWQSRFVEWDSWPWAWDFLSPGSPRPICPQSPSACPQWAS